MTALIAAVFPPRYKKMSTMRPLLSGQWRKAQWSTYSRYDTFSPDLVTLIDQGGDGIAVPVWVPKAQAPALRAVAEKGITTMMFNSGQKIKEGGGAINHYGSDITGTAQTIETELGAEASINTVITLAAWLSDADENAIQQSGATDRVKLGSFDMNAADPTPTKAGTQTTAIDQQPYLRGFLGDNHACGKHRFGTDPALTAP